MALTGQILPARVRVNRKGVTRWDLLGLVRMHAAQKVRDNIALFA